jgi:hypothetical protein
MTQRYFEKFPLINYNGQVVRDITRKVILIDPTKNNSLFSRYEVKSGERPDLISGIYYNDPYMDWLLYMSNQVIDPYYDWYMDSFTFASYIDKKYGSYELAISKIKYFRNNWRQYLDPITVDEFDNLLPEEKDYFEPLYTPSYISTTPINYRRKRLDTYLDTNSIVKFGVANGNVFSSNELVKVSYNSNTTGRGQVMFTNSSCVIMKNITSNEVVKTSVPANSFLYSSETTANTTVSSSVFLANNIPNNQVSYWSPVTYYDYENELNENNKNIKAVANGISGKIAENLNLLLNS